MKNTCRIFRPAPLLLLALAAVLPLKARGISKAPDEVSNLVLWFKADASVQTNASGVVTNWLDQSGSSLAATQGGSPTQPTVSNNWANGNPALHMPSDAGTGLTVTASSGLNITNGQARTLFLVAAAATAQNGYSEIFGWGTNRRVALGKTGTSNGRIELRGESGSFPGTLANSFTHATPVIVTVVGHPNFDIDIYLNGTLAVETNHTTAFSYPLGANNLGIGWSVYTSGGRNFRGQLAEVVLYDRALSETEHNEIGKHLARKYEINGPYYNYAEPPTIANDTDATMWRNIWARLSAVTDVAGADVRILVSTNANLGQTLTGWDAQAVIPNALFGRNTATVTGLQPGMTYYWRSYATNALGEGWSPEPLESFTTLAAQGLLTPPITDGLVLQLDAETIKGRANDALLPVWMNAASDALIFDRDSAALQPQYKASTAALGNRPTVYFNQSQGRGLDTPAIPIGANADRTLILVAIPTHSGDGELFSRATDQRVSLVSNIASLRTGNSLLNTDANALPLNDGHIVVVTDSATDTPRTQVHVNGTIPGYSYTSGNDSTRFFAYTLSDGLVALGYSAWGAIRSYGGHLAELLLYDRVLNAKELNLIGYHLETKYGLDTAYSKPPSGTIIMIQ